MSEWKEYKLGELTTLVTKGTTPSSLGGKFVDTGINYIKSEAVGHDGRLDKSTFVCIDEVMHQKLKRSQLAKDDILFSMAGIFLGKNALVPEEVLPANTNQALAIIRLNKEKANPKFIHYYLRQRNVVDFVNNMSGQSAQPNINFEEIKSIDILLPELTEQIQIASILSSLDDKIDLLHRQNKILTQLSETLFRQWFVEEANESWEVAKLGNVAVVQNGYAFSSKDYVSFQGEHLEVLKMGHIEKGGGLRTNPKKDFVPREEKLKRWTMNKNDIIMAMTDMKDNVVILGVPAMIDKSDKYVLNQRVARIYLESNKKLINSYLLYIQLNNKEFIATLQSKANSGVQVNLSTEVIKDCDILIPPMELQKEKGNVISELYLKKENNDIQIKTLTQLRDMLLPKLMSGEVRVKN